MSRETRHPREPGGELQTVVLYMQYFGRDV